MPPGPSQAGRFKPRKPAKKIRAGAAAAAAVVPDGARSSSSSAAAPRPDAAPSSSARGGRGGGQRGGGRGARGGGRGGGRGRRAPTIQGQTFFQAVRSSDKTKPTKSRSKPGAKEEQQTGLVKKKKDDTSEEVVGQLDTAIGSALGEDGKRSVLEDYNDGEGGFAGHSKFADEDDENAGYINPDGIFYDSDSSLEESKPRPRSNNIQPSRLPYPAAPLPVGIGGDKRPEMYTKPGETIDNSEAEVHNYTRPSPFVDPNDVDALRKEMGSFFLFQMPTRIPALVQTATASSKKDKDAFNLDQEMEDAEQEVKVEDAGPAPIQTAEVETAPVTPGSFDNAMIGAVPGRLGKLVVYKSGKTVLVFEGPDGSSEIRLDVSEGLTCGFEQQAVLIDPEQGRFVKLGSVHKTAVVKPDLDKAFATN